jgi:hypothetical protein
MHATSRDLGFFAGRRFEAARTNTGKLDLEGNMTWTKRITPLAVAAVIGIGGVMPALGATSAHWSTKQCQSYKSSFLKRHKKPTKAQIAAANKLLKKHGCTIKA